MVAGMSTKAEGRARRVWVLRPGMLWLIVCLVGGRLAAADSNLVEGRSGTIAGPLSPEQALASFQLAPGLRVDLVAAEPEVLDPVAMAFDERGRLFVAEDRGYPTGPGRGKAPAGDVVVLEDQDGDGRFEKRTLFADQLTFPNGLLPWRDGVFVTCAPDLLYLKDTDGDGRSDFRQVVFTGFSTKGSTQLRVAYPTLAPDGWIYLASGLVGGRITSPQYPEHPAVDLARGDFRFRPGTGKFEAVDGKAQFGLAFNAAGDRFLCMNRVHIEHVVLPSRYLRRNPFLAFSETVQKVPDQMTPDLLRSHGAGARLYPISQNITTADSHAGTFTAACGLLIYEGGALPEETWGNDFACDPTGNLIHRDRLEAAGATYRAQRARAGLEFLASPDNWFRPVFLSEGPDGALYVCDMYRKTIEHPDYLPEEIRKHTDFESGKDRGRIYRITSRAASATRQARNPAQASLEELCRRLNDPYPWWRRTAQRLILQQGDRAAVGPLRRLMFDPGVRAEARVLTLWLMKRCEGLDDETLTAALQDPSAAVRRNSLKLIESRLAASPAKWLPRALALAGDPDAAVRFQCALTLGESTDPRRVPVLARLAVKDAEDHWTRMAVLSSVGQASAAFAQNLWAETRADLEANPDHAAADLVMLSETAQLVANGDSEETQARLLREVLTSTRAGAAPCQMAWLTGVGEGLRQSGKGEKKAWARLITAAGQDVAARLQGLEAKASQVALDRDQPVAVRREAVAVLGLIGGSDALKSLSTLLEPRQPTDLQTEAARVVGRSQDAQVMTAIVTSDRWAAYSPVVRQALLAALLSGAKQSAVLLDALERGAVPLSALSPAQRDQLSHHTNPALRERARRLFGNFEKGDRMQVYQAYKSVLELRPDAANGRRVFAQQCAACHRLDREGVPVGPDLFGIRNQAKESILLHILVPEYEIVPGFENYVVETTDGRTLSGLIASESPAGLTLRRAQGEEQTLLRTAIRSVTATGLSLMPQELEKNMTRQELADLLAYLKGEQ